MRMLEKKKRSESENIGFPLGKKTNKQKSKLNKK